MWGVTNIFEKKIVIFPLQNFLIFSLKEVIFHNKNFWEENRTEKNENPEIQGFRIFWDQM